MQKHTLPTYFVSHGGGPWPWMQAENGGMYDKLAASLQDIRARVKVPLQAILMVSGHWEADRYLLSSAANPGMLYDYFGFPPHTYEIQYRAPGHPQLAANIASMLVKAGFDAGTDLQRGFDHGTFSVMQVMHPEADVPVVQLSINTNYDPGQHIGVGRVLAPLRDQGVLIVGSGLSYHNLRQMRSQAGVEASAAFDEWLQETLLDSDPQERHERLLRWSEAPSARAAHPREDHLLPLMVAVGATWSEPARMIYQQSDFMGGISVSSYCFGS